MAERSYWGINGKHKKSEKHALKFLKSSVIGVGWPDTKSLQRTVATFDAFRDVVDNTYQAAPDWNGEDRNRWIGQSAALLFNFVHELNAGDVVVLPTTNTDRMLHFGIVQGPYRYDAKFDPEYTHLRPVKWVRTLSRDTLSNKTRDLLNFASSFRRIVNPNAELSAILSSI